MYMDLAVVFLTPTMLFSNITVARFYIPINWVFIQIYVSARIDQCLTDVLPFVQRHVVFSISFKILSDSNI